MYLVMFVMVIAVLMLLSKAVGWGRRAAAPAAIQLRLVSPQCVSIVSSTGPSSAPLAEEARAAAKLITPGPEQDLLMRKAIKAETLASATDRLALRGR
jgi:hypothetical protein